MNYPMVIWQGTEPLHSHGYFRLVFRGPPRHNVNDDVPFGLEQRLGPDAMKVMAWGKIKNPEAQLHAIQSLTHALGQVLCVDPRKLNLDHPLFCEENLSVAEGRQSRGCDCQNQLSGS